MWRPRVSTVARHWTSTAAPILQAALRVQLSCLSPAAATRTPPSWSAAVRSFSSGAAAVPADSGSDSGPDYDSHDERSASGAAKVATAPRPRKAGSTSGALVKSPRAGQPTFESIGVAPHVIGKLLTYLKVRYPTNVQQAAVPLIQGNLSSPAPPENDFIIHSETGSGKTLAYLIPLFSRLDPKLLPTASLIAVIVTPTRELAHQVTQIAEALAKSGRKKAAVAAAAAGNPLGAAPSVRIMRAVGEITSQKLHQLRTQPPHILIGTPTSLAQLIPEHANIGHLKYLVLDEADELARNHSIKALEHILKATTRVTNRPSVVAVSATSSLGLTKVVDTYLRKRGLTKVDLVHGGLRVPPTIDHYLVRVGAASQAHPLVTRFLAAVKPRGLLCFLNSAASLEALEAFLRAKNIAVAMLGNAYANKERNAGLEALSSGRVRILLSTEMAARGMDLPRLSHVANIEPPSSTREYVHRAGRVGRLSSQTPGRRGAVVTWVWSDEQLSRMVDTAHELNVTLQEMTFEGGEAKMTTLVSHDPARNVVKGSEALRTPVVVTVEGRRSKVVGGRLQGGADDEEGAEADADDSAAAGGGSSGVSAAPEPGAPAVEFLHGVPLPVVA